MEKDLKHEKRMQMVHAISIGIYAFYSLTLVVLIVSNWPHVGGWIAAAIWFAMYVFNNETTRKFIADYQKLTHQILDSWDETIKSFEEYRKQYPPTENVTETK